MSRKLTFDELKYVQDEMKAKGKRVNLAYLFAVFLGLFGAHMAYLEKKGSAIIRFILTLTVITLGFLMYNTTSELNVSDLTLELQQYSSALFVAFIGVLISQIALIVYDLISIPGIVRKTNEQIEEESRVKVVQSEYAELILREEKLPDKLITETIKKINPEIENNINEAVLKLMRTDFQQEKESIQNKINSLKEQFETKEQLHKDNVETLELKQKEVLLSIENFRKEFEENFRKNESLSNEESKSSSDVSNELEASLKEPLSNREKMYLRKGIFIDPVKVKFKRESEENNEKKETVTTSIVVEENNDVLLNDEFLTTKNGETIVKGYIVGQLHNDNFISTSKFKSDNNVLIAHNVDEKDLTKMIAVQLSSRSGLRNKLGLKSNPDKHFKRIVISGEEFKYFNHRGLKKAKVISID